MNRSSVVIAVLALLGAALAGAGAVKVFDRSRLPPHPAPDGPLADVAAEEEAPERRAPRGPEPHTVLFVVLDTVRSLNLELCGYERPNTPFLKELAGRAAWTCQAYSPGAWTLPSHASYFSGLRVPEHGLEASGTRMPDHIPLLAEEFLERGYRTAMVSGNMCLVPLTGLTRGFEKTFVSGSLKRGGVPVSTSVRRVLDRVDPEQPLFLFVNIFNAHDPYPEIPEGIGWVPPQPQLKLHAQSPNPTLKYNRYTTGRMDPEEAKSYLGFVRNGYDYGIYRADKVLQDLFSALRESGRLDDSHRWVVTSDHGEFLGEHGNLRHGCFTYEEVTRVPFLYYDSATAGSLPAIEGPFSAMNAYHLLRSGALPEVPVIPNSVSQRRMTERPSADMASMWASPTDKITWREGVFEQFDLAADPGEARPSPLADHPLLPALTELAELHEKALEAPSRNEELREMLEGVGYLE